MQQVKIFKSLESDVTELEEEVNTWIRESGAKIVAITGNIAPQTVATGKGDSLGKGAFAPSDVIIIVVYVKPS